ncbi:hypothetical protein MPSEU_000550200 [Mayamaea pseudoterrestris]|nr:hypothetical protein MPSEU_000550200 [Mayamaea pseudoterrestris]
MTITLQHESILKVFDSQSIRTPIESCEGFVLVNEGDWCQLHQCSGGDDADTLSTTSLSDSSSMSECERRVSFFEHVVTDTWFRPYTPMADVEDLYYSVEDVARFRSEYRLERRLQSDSSSDDDVVDEAPSSKQTQLLDDEDDASASFLISRVVVLHNDALQTLTCSMDEFDNDSFWQGSITWY